MKNKKHKGYAIFYDRKFLPDELGLSDVLDWAKETGVLMYDSTKGRKNIMAVKGIHLSGNKFKERRKWIALCVKTGKEINLFFNA